MSDIVSEILLEFESKVPHRCLFRPPSRFFIDKIDNYLYYIIVKVGFCLCFNDSNRPKRGILEVRAGKPGSLSVTVDGCGAGLLIGKQRVFWEKFRCSTEKLL
jgi:hypothetical protein